MTEQKFERVEEITKRLFDLEPNKVTITRWHRDGSRGKKLRILKVAGRILSTVEWVVEFFTVDPVDGPSPPSMSVRRGSESRNRAYERALEKPLR